MFKSQITYCIEGLNLHKAVVGLQQIGVKVTEAKAEKGKIVFTIKNSDKRKTVAYLSARCYNVIWSKYRGGALVVHTLTCRIVLVLAFFALLVAVGYCSNRCLFVNVHHSEQDEKIISQVKEVVGQTNISSLGRMDADTLLAIETLLYKHIDCAYVLVSSQGCVLDIDIRASTKAEKPADFYARRDITSNVSGVVERIVYISGTCLVAVGDTVDVGQVLIKGETTFSDQTTQDVRAQGSIFVRTTVSFEVNFQPSVIKYRRTGNTKNYVQLTVGRKVVSSKENTFEHFEVEQKSVLLFPLGIVVNNITAHELEQYTQQVTFDQSLPTLYLLAEQGARQLAQFDVDQVTFEINGNVVKCIASGIVCVK